MHRRMHWMILVLLLVVVGLMIAILRPRQESETADDSGIVTPASNETELFVENGKWGVRTGFGRTVLEPEWYYLRAMGEDLLIARSDGSSESRYGIIRYNGEIVVPFFYDSIDSKAEDLWIAQIEENGVVQYHLYHQDGTLWMTTAWDDTKYTQEQLMLQRGDDSFIASLGANGIEWEQWHSAHMVGLHTMTMDFNAAQLRHLPDWETLYMLGEAAACYLNGLMIATPDTLSFFPSNIEDNTNFSGAYYYTNCTLQDASVSRVKIVQTEGFPAYLVQMQVTYIRTDADGAETTISTAILLDISRNLNGSYVFTGMRDLQQEVSGGAY